MHKITSFIIAEAGKAKRSREVSSTVPTKSAPHYFEKSVPSQFVLGQEKIILDGREIELFAKSYHPDAVLVEGTIVVENIFADDILELKDKLQEACYQFARKNGAREEPAEEYTIYRISGYKGEPEGLVKDKAKIIAGLLKSETLPLDPKEIEYTLSYQFKYGKDDLIIIDWDGAFIFDPDGESGDTIELFELANYQLLRYRVLDEDLDEKMKMASKTIRNEEQTKKRLKLFKMPSKEISHEFKEVIKIRSESIAKFEAMERDIKLIGDWYLARLYDLISKKFRLEEWRKTAKEKLESLEDVYTIAAENLGMSHVQHLELIQIWLFFILQVGWFAILILEFIYYNKK